MPQVTVYVRDEDLSKWKALERKAEWLRSKLNDIPMDTQVVTDPEKIIDLDNLYRKDRGGLKTFGAVTHLEPFVPKPPDPETGYPCCKKARPCKHWQWDSGQTLWVNSLTGKTKEG